MVTGHARFAGLKKEKVKMETVIVDRFEGDWAVLEEEKGDVMRVERSRLPAECREGDVLVRENDHYWIDRKATEERRQRMAERMEKLFSE